MTTLLEALVVMVAALSLLVGILLMVVRTRTTHDSGRNGLHQMVAFARKDFTEYLHEFKCQKEPEGLDREAYDELVIRINRLDVAIFEIANCPFCQDANKNLREHARLVAERSRSFDTKGSPRILASVPKSNDLDSKDGVVSIAEGSFKNCSVANGGSGTNTLQDSVTINVSKEDSMTGTDKMAHYIPAIQKEASHLQSVFTRHPVVIDHELADLRTGTSLAHMVGKRNIKFPAIFIRGVYIGGNDKLQQLLSIVVDPSDSPLLKPFVEFIPAEQIPDPHLCNPHKGYANVVRAYAFMQVLAFAAMEVLLQHGMTKTCILLILAVVTDMIIFVFTGAAPLCPIGSLLTRLLWSRRGNVVTLWPYKVIWMFYTCFFTAVITCLYSFGDDYSINVGIDGMGSLDMQSCGAAVVAGGFLMNSSMLAFTRL